MTAQDIIKRAMKLIQAIPGSGENPTAAEAQDGLETLNEMLDAWSAQRLGVFTIQRQTFNLVVGQQAYTMGTGGDFNTARPPTIERMSIISLNNPSQPLELAVNMLTDAQWQAIPVKNIQSSLPLNCWDDGGFPLRTLSYWCVPNTAVSTAIYSWTALSQFADLNTNYTFPPGYAEAMRFNLAARLAPEFGRQMDPAVAVLAIESFANIKRQNAPITDMKCDPALLYTGPGTYNWLTDNAGQGGGNYP